MMFLYLLRDPRDLVVRYVGASANPKKRLVAHRLGYDGSTRDWCQELRSLGLEPLQEVFEEAPEETWEDREIFWIAFHRKTVLNKRKGGDRHRAPGSKHTEKAKRAIALGNTGKKRSPETVERLRKNTADPNHPIHAPEALAKMRAKKRTKEARQAAREHALGNRNSRGLKHSAESIEHMSNGASERYKRDPSSIQKAREAAALVPHSAYQTRKNLLRLALIIDGE